MRILIDITHPADVHQFRHMIALLKKDGHELLITARDKECTYDLLDAFKIPYRRRKGYKGLLGKAIGLIKINSFLLKQSHSFKPDVLIGSSGNCYISQVGTILRKPSIIFEDTEFSTLQNWLTFPFATKICTPKCFSLDLGKKQVRYNGTKDLSYLHPKRFKKNKDTKKLLGLKKNDKFIIVRLVSFQASHDVGQKGISNVIETIEMLEKAAKVFISSEEDLPEQLYKKRLNIRPENMHNVLSEASLFFGESATMASEAAHLGIPAIFISDSSRGYIDMLEKKYGLMRRYPTDEIESAAKMAVRWISDEKTADEWKVKRKRLIEDTVDVAEWMTEFVEGFNI